MELFHITFSIGHGPWDEDYQGFKITSPTEP